MQPFLTAFKFDLFGVNKYIIAYFLVKHYFPFHDRLAAMEALVMDRIIQCDTNKRANSIEQLKRYCADTACELSKEWEGIV